MVLALHYHEIIRRIMEARIRVNGFMPQVTIAEFEKYHAKRFSRSTPRASLYEVIVTLVLSTVMTPFAFVTASIIPIMGPVTVLLGLSLTALYLFFRRSFIIAAAAGLSSLLFWSALFGTVQSYKNDLDVALFFFTALGIPVTFIYSMFIGSQIWIVRGGVE